MNPLNSLLIEGNVVRDVELRTVAENKKLCSFSLAVNRYTAKGDGTYSQNTSYFDVDCWDKVAQVASEQAMKGRGIRIVGRLVQETWKDKDGKNCSKVKILAEHVEFKPVTEKPAMSESTNTDPPQANAESFEIAF